MELYYKFNLYKGKIHSFLKGEYYSLTKGLLMGDPFTDIDEDLSTDGLLRGAPAPGQHQNIAVA